MAVFFKRGGRTLDIGCASGRDLAYLKGSGYEIEGLDAVASFVEHCQRNLTDIPVYYDSLPELKSLEDSRYDNLLLSAVLMHLPSEDLTTAIKNILRISKPGGRILISIRNFRETEVVDQKGRERDGRLFSNIPVPKLIELFAEFGAKVMFQEDQDEGRREDVIWHNFVFEKNL
ncbi:MAG: class I SAM-dependent methyltransferase [Bacteriovoracaceae bacterium]|nr:class I SAM-dependent methyltransferase [Bacteriovoracaceae bacterium]